VTDYKTRTSAIGSRTCKLQVATISASSAVRNTPGRLPLYIGQAPVRREHLVADGKYELVPSLLAILRETGSSTANSVAGTPDDRLSQ